MTYAAIFDLLHCRDPLPGSLRSSTEHSSSFCPRRKSLQLCSRRRRRRSRGHYTAQVDSTTAGSWGWTPYSGSGTKSGRNTPTPGHRRPPTRPSTPSVPRRQPCMQVSSLLSDPHTRYYNLEVIQHPVKTAAFEDNVLSRLALTPPLIVRLTVRDPAGNHVLPDDELPFLLAHLSLFDEHGINQIDPSSAPGLGPASRMLYGNLVSAVENPLEDLQGNLGLFFLFPDVSVRWRGKFQLRITLVRISSVDTQTGSISLANHGMVLADTRTRTFEVVHHSQYSAIPQTRLTQSFIRQGARMFPYS